MIGQLKGTLLEKNPPTLLVDTGGVGYEIEAPMSTVYQLPALGEPVTLRIHQGLRDEVPVLYGFLTRGERDLFRALIRVNGVGPKMALAILSGISAPEFRRCVEQKDTATLTRLPGIGKKIAERLTLEMQDRLDGLGAGAATGATVPGITPAAVPDDPLAEAQAALVALGYRPAEAHRLLQGVESDGASSEALIRAALQKAVRA